MVSSVCDSAQSTRPADYVNNEIEGGPLDGLYDAGENGKATTYADLVSRAAIIDSSDERSYSEDPSSNAPAGVAKISPREELSLSPKDDLTSSPRTDLLLSHRTEFEEDDEEDDQILYVAPSGSPRESEEGGSSQLSSGFNSPKSSQLSSAFEEEKSSEDPDPGCAENENLISSEDEKVTENNDSKALASNIVVKSLENAPLTPIYEASESESAKQEFSDSTSTYSAFDSVLKEDFERKLNSEDNLRNGSEKSQAKENPISFVENSAEKQVPQDEDPTTASKIPKTEESEAIAASSAETGAANEDENDSEKSDVDEGIDGSFGSESISAYDTMTESEAEILSADGSPVRIVVTSARKVERELLESSQKSDQDATDDIEHGQKERASPAGVVIDNVKNGQDEGQSVVGDVLDDVRNERQSAAVDDKSRTITREDVSDVASLSRPVSARPIPSEGEVKDPFVDFLASTRQKQIDRAVDVQAIFKADDSQKKVGVKTDQKRLEEQEAAAKVQRAYRKHLARSRAARKCRGMNPETLEWARSYKAMLLEKREMRKRRLHEARQCTRTLQRRDAKKMSAIGPHTELYEIYHPDPEFPDPGSIQESAVEIQRMVRGWLVRRRLYSARQMAGKRKASLTSVVDEYRSLLDRTQRRHGKLRPSLSLTYEELMEYLHQRTKFELAFNKRQFWNEMESAELNAFFNDCGLFPSQDEITEACESVGKSMDSRKKKKMHSSTAMSLDDVIEVAFHIYVPSGTRMKIEHTRSSTWMTPIFGEEEGLKLIKSVGDTDSDVESADFQLASQFVAKTFKERKEIDKT